ncbi:cystinosin homolog [Ornithodoros turicata]|uniref:cystinosin homolog n=1 Tax=Ornithodoros turicata TaxID=34597 RepID=UPI0031396C5E
MLALLLLLLILCAGDAQIQVSTNVVDILVTERSGFSVSLTESSSKERVDVRPYEGEDVLASPGNLTFWLKENETRWINVSATRAGHAVISVNSADTEHFVTVNVFKVRWLNVLSAIFGWVYFVAWSVSFYPQIYLNWKRKSVVGLDFDFVFLNVTGFVAYSTFNLGIFFSTVVQEEYLSSHPSGAIPVQVNDIVFSLHATLATVITAIQCLIYERQNQTISLAARILLGALWLAALIFLLVTVAGVNPYTPWFTFLNFVSGVKLAITLIKYIPQAFFNFRRKSTIGWSIGNILLDFTGGVFSMLQMFVIAYNFDDWTSLFGNVTKFGLGVVSIGFDVLFMLQHYVFFSSHKKKSHPTPYAEALSSST